MDYIHNNIRVSIWRIRQSKKLTSVQYQSMFVVGAITKCNHLPNLFKSHAYFSLFSFSESWVMGTRTKGRDTTNLLDSNPPWTYWDKMASRDSSFSTCGMYRRNSAGHGAWTCPPRWTIDKKTSLTLAYEPSRWKTLQVHLLEST